MFKYVPDPPEKDATNESDPTSPYSSTDSKNSTKPPSAPSTIT